MAGKGAKDCRYLSILRKFLRVFGAFRRVVRCKDVEIGVHRRAADRAPENVQAVRDQGIGRLQQLDPELIGRDAAKIDSRGLFGNQNLDLGALRRIGCGIPPAGETVLQLLQALVEPGLRQWRCEVRHRDGV